MNKPEIETLRTGCKRQPTAGRGRYELMSPFVLERDARLFEWGAKHRGERNWEAGCPFSRCVQSIYRHLVKYLMREPDEDHDDNLAAIRFWAGALMHYEEMIRRGRLPADLDDLPRYHRDGYRIYIAGPYSAEALEDRWQNMLRAAYIGWQCARSGHIPYVPHAATYWWHGLLSYEDFMRIDLAILESWATALFYIAPSPGADRELSVAEERRLPIWRQLAEVPNWRPGGNFLEFVRHVAALIPPDRDWLRTSMPDVVVSAD